MCPELLTPESKADLKIPCPCAHSPIHASICAGRQAGHFTGQVVKCVGTMCPKFNVDLLKQGKIFELWAEVLNHEAEARKDARNCPESRRPGRGLGERPRIE